MSICTPGAVPQGRGSCVFFKGKLQNVILQEYDSDDFNDGNFGSLEDINDSSIWVGRLGTDLSMYMFEGLAAEAEITADPVVNTNANDGSSFVGRFNPPSLTLYVKSNICDFEQYVKVLRNTKMKVWLKSAGNVLEGYKYLTSADDVAIAGKTALVTADQTYVSVADDNTNVYRIYVHFQNSDEWAETTHISPSWNIGTTLPKAVPEGLKLEMIEGFGGIGQTVKVTKSCGAPYLGLTAGEFYENGTALTTVTDNADSTYSVTVAGTSGSSLQVKVGSGPYTYVSNKLIIG